MISPKIIHSCPSQQQLECYARGELHGQAAQMCEDHLEVCGDCQRLLSVLFESGKGPAWLGSFSGQTNESRAASAQDSTLRSMDEPTSSSSPSPKKSAAHLLWQQQALAQADATMLEQSLVRIPQAIGRYRVQSILGQGGFGRVYLAQDEKLQRNVALKVPHYSLQPSQVHWDLMLAEAQTVAALDHPGIVPIYDVAATDEVPMFLVSKLIEGQTLAERLAHQSFTPLAAAELVIQIADALQYAHAQGVIHRDIKPQNILLDREGHVYLADFGLAWRGAGDLRTFPSAGTPFYMSPEQLSGNSQAIDERSDIYSLAKVLQQMLGGFNHLGKQSAAQAASMPSMPSMTGNSLAQLSSGGVGNSIQPTARLSDAIPSQLQAICDRATAHAPEQRYQSAAELAEALRHFVGLHTPVIKRYRWLGLSVVAIAAACILFSVISWYGQSGTAEQHAAEQAVEALLWSDPSTMYVRARSEKLSTAWAQSLLRAAATNPDPDKRIRARLGLMNTDSTLVLPVAQDMLAGPVEMTRVFVPLLLPYKEQLVPSMWEVVQRDNDVTRKLNAAAFLAIAAEGDERWQDHQLVDNLLHDLVTHSASDLKCRVDSLVNQREVLLDAVRRNLHTNAPNISPLERLHLNSVWELLVRDNLQMSIELMLTGPPSIYTSILNRLQGDDPETLRLLREVVHEQRAMPANSPPQRLFQERHLAAMALLKFGHEEDYWPLWRSQSDPTHLALQIALFGFEPLTKDRLIARLRQTSGLSPVRTMPNSWEERLFSAELSERRNLLLALSAYQFKKLIDSDPMLLVQLQELYLHDADPCVHYLAQQILTRSGLELPELAAATCSIEHNGAWFINSLGVAMVIVPSTPDIGYRYAIANCEVQRRHFAQFLTDTKTKWTGGVLADDANLEDRMRAQIGMSWFDAAAFCNWLSRREGLEECYLPNADGNFAEGMSVKPNVHQLNGYRIPTSHEWEHAGRAGTVGNLYFGNSVFAAREYVWDMSTAHGVSQPVGQLRPNSIGLCDIHGNASEWTMPDDMLSSKAIKIEGEELLEHRGGHVLTERLAGTYFGSHETTTPANRSLPTGLRVVRSLR